MNARDEIWMAVTRAIGRRRLPGEEPSPPPDFTVTIEGETVTIDGSNLTLSEA